MSATHMFARLACAGLLVSCAQVDVHDVQVFDGGTALDPPSFDEYVAASAVQNESGTYYIVEGDILLSDVEQLRTFYDAMYGDREKSIVNLVGGAFDRRDPPTGIRYCFSGGWGQPNGSYTAPALGPVQANIEQAMRGWEAVANVKFEHRANLDGVGCNNSGANPGVDFTITHYPNASTAKGPFPSNAWAGQQLQVPTTGISRLLAIHEIGHTIGLRHEHIHSGATPQCPEDTSFRELTAFDTNSCMKYSNCATLPGVINGTEISAFDAIGIREVYGAPASWHSAYAFLLR